MVMFWTGAGNIPARVCGCCSCLCGKSYGGEIPSLRRRNLKKLATVPQPSKGFGRLPLHPPGTIAAHEVFDLGTGDTVIVAENGMFQG